MQSNLFRVRTKLEVGGKGENERHHKVEGGKRGCSDE